MLGFLSRRPDNLGVKNGRLADCPNSPNCVSTTAPDPRHAIAPLTFTTTPAAAQQRLRDILKNLPRTTIITDDENYLYAEFRTLLIRYVDDVEFLIDSDTHTIHFRSASRVGHSDFGVNRRRMEDIRRRFNETH